MEAAGEEDGFGVRTGVAVGEDVAHDVGMK